MKRLVPENRLLFTVGFVLLPVSLIVVAVPGFSAAAIAIAAALGMLVAADALKAAGQLKGIRVSLPEVVRLSRYRKAEFQVQVINEGVQKRSVRLGFAFPNEIETPAKEIVVLLPAGAAVSSLNWPCRGVSLGGYQMRECYVEVPSYLGLWVMRTALPVKSEIRVYPNLLPERKRLSPLFLNRGFGIHAQRQVGKGREFEQLREYQNGDSYEDIHWKATARRRQPITKVYQLERTQRVYIVIDSSRLSNRRLKMNSADDQSGPGNQEPGYAAIIDRYITASLLVGMAAERQGDLFGLILFDDKVKNFIAAKNGKAHFSTCRDTLFRLKARKVTPDFPELFTFINTRVRRRSLLIFLTHLDDPVLAENLADKIALIARKHIVLVNTMRPMDAQPIFASQSIATVDDIYRSLGGHMLWQGLRETEMILQRRGVGFAMLENENMCPELVSQYLALKRRQVL